MLVSQSTPVAAPKVLLIDDDRDSREVLAESLQNRGYMVVSVGNGRDALNHLRRFSPPAIIILDLMMPIMDGCEFLAHQARDAALLHIPVIVLTALPPPHPHGPKAVLQKPIQLESLARAIERFLSPPA